MSSLAALFLTSFKAVLNTLIQYGIGVSVAYANVVREEDMRGFSSVMNYILVPVLTVVSLGKGMSLPLLRSEGWVLAVIGFLAAAEYALIALLLRRFARPSAEFHRLFVLMVCFPNVVAIPLAVTQTLCDLGAFDHEIARDECVTRSRALTFMYISLDSFNIWVVMHAYLSSDRSTDGEAAAAGLAVQAVQIELDAPTKVPGESDNGTVSEAPPIAAHPPSHSAAAAAALQPPAAEAHPSLAAVRPSISERSTMPLVPRAPAWRWCGLLHSVSRQLAAMLRKPPVTAIVVGVVIGLVEPVQRTLFEHEAPLHVVGLALITVSEATVPMVNLMLAFSLGHKMRALKSWRELLGSEAAGISPRVMAFTTLGRMVIIPLCHGTLLYALLDLLPEGHLVRVILFVEMAPPTASMVIVLAHITKKPRAAQLAAFAMVPQYMIASFTMTLVIAFALHVTAPEAVEAHSGA